MLTIYQMNKSELEIQQPLWKASTVTYNHIIASLIKYSMSPISWIPFCGFVLWVERKIFKDIINMSLR